MITSCPEGGIGGGSGDGGGDGGGEIIGSGTPESIAKIKKSYTGKYLKQILKIN